MRCVNPGKSGLFENLGHKLGDGILSQGLVLVPTLTATLENFVNGT